MNGGIMGAWKDEFNRRVVTFLAREGMPMSKVPLGEYGGYAARNWHEICVHIAGCRLDVPKCTWEDTEWTEFAGTFDEPQWNERTGINLTATCECGQIRDQKFRYTGSRADLLVAITEMPEEE